jgi:hypothetical protein
MGNRQEGLIRKVEEEDGKEEEKIFTDVVAWGGGGVGETDRRREE